ncbi:MAG: hypothetical protein IJ515_04800 [Clostridia bacterium]|nr:hypothetical protein [Clostridia bacterium]
MKDKKNVTKDSTPSKYRGAQGDNAIPGVNTPGVELPAFNPPVPNRAWTALKNGKDIDALTPEEKRNLYLGRDSIN